ncbi:hypothetical protein MAM1_0265c08928 [Mucor ambiguus]|uniref:RING-type domain-containing protein n=1 Tax=Mucor ambiguus TaxID=91626 RepID=A0A0C9MFB8_9FUNG|nr:hypothetical protein MAM1_0265c08928 [Mucor ambiguus]
MGQRQSSQSSDPSDNNNNDITMNESNDSTTNNDTNENTARRGRIFRPSARLNVERNNPISRASTESQRRSERRTRRAHMREEQLNAATQQQQQQQGESENEEAGLATLMSSVIEALDAVAALARNRPTAAAPTNISNIATTTTTSTSEESAESVNSPFARMIAQVMSEAVLASFRSGQISTPVPSDSQARQQLTMHLPADLFRQMEPGRSEDVFLRPFRLPILITPISATTDEENPGTDNTSGNSSGHSSNSSGTSTRNTRSTTSTAVNADGEAPTLNEGNSQVSQLMFLPVLICGRRSASPSTTSNAENPSTAMSLSDFLNTSENTNENTQRPGIRSSTRIRERQQRQQESAEQEQEQGRSRTTSADTSPGGGQWTVWILSGPRVESFMSDNPTYEDLIQLADLLGPARLPTVTQEAIDNHIPIVKYTQQVKQSMIGNTEGCQVCLDNYQSEDDVRVLECHHGFHKDCIDKWLTEGQNRCPLCRGVPIPSDSTPLATTND